MRCALDSVRVLELARFQAGPRGGMLLSDLGAEVIKIEPPGGEETRRHPPMHEAGIPAAPVRTIYRDGLGFEVLCEFTDHDGFDAVMLGRKEAAYHLAFVHKVGHKAGRAPSEDNLLVFYLPEPAEWERAVAQLEELGLTLVAPLPAPTSEKIVVDGSTGVMPLVAALAKAYQERYPAAAVEMGKGAGNEGASAGLGRRHDQHRPSGCLQVRRVRSQFRRRGSHRRQRCGASEVSREACLPNFACS